jgi:hypothetical protein
VGHENADADHAKQRCHYLDHHDGPLRPAETKRHRRPNSQKNSINRDRFAPRLMISESVREVASAMTRQELTPGGEIGDSLPALLLASSNTSLDR